MTWISVRTGRDYLEQFGKRSPIKALAELVRNALDAEAKNVSITIATTRATIGGPCAERVVSVVVTDDGLGMSRQRAVDAFASLGDSWKRDQGGRTPNGHRVLHGRRGCGRFLAYAIGPEVTWTSVSRSDRDAGVLERVVVTGSARQIDGFQIDGTETAGQRPGTTVTIAVPDGRSLPALLRGDIPDRLAERLAGYLLREPGVRIDVNRRPVDPRALVDGEPVRIELAWPDSPGTPPPVLTIVDWCARTKKAPELLLCPPGGAALFEVSAGLRECVVQSTGYLEFAGFADDAVDRSSLEERFAGLLEETRRALAEHARARTELVRASIVAGLRHDCAYPYDAGVDDVLVRAEQHAYDLLLVASREAFSGTNRLQRAMSAHLLQLALRECPESVDRVLAQVLNLSDEERTDQSDVLRHSALPSIVATASEITRRLDLVRTLRHVVYGPNASRRMCEVEQLHQFVRDNTWLFGDHWQLASSEKSITDILRTVLPPHGRAFETDLSPGPDGRLPVELRGRVDLVLHRVHQGVNGYPARLVVELKRPSARLGEAELLQVTRYANALSTDSGLGPSSWTFYLVGAEVVADEIGPFVAQPDREWGHIAAGHNFDIHVTSWARLLDSAASRLEFLRRQLRLDAEQDESVERVRQRHAALMPSQP